MRSVLLTLLFFCLTIPAPARGGEPFDLIDSRDLMALFDRNAPKQLLVDVRSADEYRSGHIPGAVSIPLDRLEQEAGQPGVPRDYRLLFYCSGST